MYSRRPERSPSSISRPGSCGYFSSEDALGHLCTYSHSSSGSPTGSPSNALDTRAMAASRTMAAAPASVASAESGCASRWIQRSMHCWRVGSSVSACGATVRGTNGTPEAGARTACVLCVGPEASCPAPQVPTVRRRPVRVAHVQYGGPGTCVSAQGGALISCSCSAGEKDAGKSTALDLCGRRGRCGRPVGTCLPIGRGWPRLAEASRGWRPPCA